MPKPWLAAFLGALVGLAGCVGSGGPEPGPPSTEGGTGVPEGSVRFVVLGDVGTGEADQYRVAAAVARVCEDRGCLFALVAGDNVYPDGVTSPHDPQFDEKFESPYAGVDLPFYLVLGNHDNGNGAGDNPEVGDHQVAYAQRTDRPSDKFHMPQRNYAFTVGHVTLFGLDSGPSEVSQPAAWLPGSRGPAMEAWLREELARTATPWRLVFAHHPYASNSVHGDAGLFDNIPGRGLAYRLMLEDLVCGNAQVFFAGHDHTLQWLAPVDGCPGTQFVVSGAGGAEIYARGPPPDHAAFYENYEDHGFWWIDVTGDTFTGAAFDADAGLLFERRFVRA